ncbi:MAG: hypothetical protein JXR32_04320 [Anaerolineaceae bacterium]|nr:hypothetical protein [Anaerolineaceae bacterium]
MSIDRSSHSCSPENLERFRHSIPSQVRIPESEWDYVSPQLVERKFEKSAYLVRASEVADSFYFIINGLVRI